MGADKEPHDGVLRDLYVPKATAETSKQEARDMASWDLTERQLCDLELLLGGAFSPLDGFLSRRDYESVLTEMRLSSGALWPMPVMLDVTSAFAETIGTGETIALRDREGVLIATLLIEDVWAPELLVEAKAIFGTTDTAHPGVAALLVHTHPVYVGGRLEGIEPPTHHDFQALRNPASELRRQFRELGWRRVVVFQTRKPMHRADYERTLRAAQELEANLLIQPVVGVTEPGDASHYARIRCYEHILKKYPAQTATLSLLTLARRMAGPREALWHAIIHKNHGCTHFLVGPDHAGSDKHPGEQPTYRSSDAQELLAQHQEELGLSLVPLQEVAYVEEKAQYVPVGEIKPAMKPLTLTRAEFRRRLQAGLEIPAWFSYPEIVAELRTLYPPRFEQGFTVFFTGLSGSGKSTIANALLVKLLEVGSRRVTLLDGDVVRKNLSSELGFSREHRDLNIQRIGYVASEITKFGGVAICAPIAPYASTRRAVRRLIESVGGFLEVHIATPLEVCEARDRKGLYAKARAGLIKEFTGISDPYEEPESPEVRIDTQALSADLAADRILVKLRGLGYIR